MDISCISDILLGGDERKSGTGSATWLGRLRDTEEYSWGTHGPQNSLHLESIPAPLRERRGKKVTSLEEPTLYVPNLPFCLVSTLHAITEAEVGGHRGTIRGIVSGGDNVAQFEPWPAMDHGARIEITRHR